MINNLMEIFERLLIIIKNIYIFFLCKKQVSKIIISEPIQIEEKKIEKYEDKYKKELETLKNKNENKNENNELSDLSLSHLLEYCPIGNVLLYYNTEIEAFEYYSDVSIPYRYLETIGRKYAVLMERPDIYIDIEDEIKKKKLEIESKKNEKPQEIEKKNNVFANFKSYNAKSGQNVSTPMTKGRSEGGIQIPSNLKRKFKSAINEQNENILLDVSNRYINKGKLSNFLFLKKPVVKKETLSYKDFLKQQKNNIDRL